MSSEEPENVAGAFIFWAYICAALYFSASIVKDIVQLYVAFHAPKVTKQLGLPQAARHRERVQIFVALSLLSFATLSYHMLSFLLVSYGDWSTNVPARYHLLWASKTTSVVDFSKHVWLWSKSSTLFQDFATVICDSPKRFWWTQQALLYSFAWNIYMCIEGARNQVPNLWTYFVLGQILPVSFSQNLFSIALLLSSPVGMKKDLAPQSRFKQWSLLALFIGSLIAAPLAVSTGIYLASLFSTRLLLFAPYFLIKPVTSRTQTRTSEHAIASFFEFKTLGLVIGLILHVHQTIKAGSPPQTLRAIHDSHAVSALGYDYVIGLLSAWMLARSVP